LGATDRPLFRTDLVSRPLEEAGYRFIEVTDPDSGHSFRFYEVEYAIACAMDGERDVVELADWAKIELGLEASPDELRTVIDTLADLGYLDTEAPALAQPAPLDRPPPAGRPVTGAAFDLPAGRGNAGPAPFDFDSPAVSSGDGNAGARQFGESSPVSMDLSEHIPLRAQDVKEAVRQSRAMQAVRPPEGAMRPSTDDDGFDDEQTPAPMRPAARAQAAAAEAGRRSNTPPPVPSGAMGKTLLGTPAPVLPPGRVGHSPTPPPMVLPDKPAEFGRPPPTSPPESSVSARVAGPSWDRGIAPSRHVAHAAEMRAVAVAVPAPQRASNLVPYLVVVLLLVLAGAGAYWFFFWRADEGLDRDSQGAPPAAPRTVEQTQDDVPARPPPPPPPPPSEIAAALEAGPTQEREVLAAQAGRIVSLVPAGSEVSEGAPVAKLEGYQKWDYAVKEAQDSQRRYQEKLDQATSRGDKEAMREAEGNVKRKQGDIDKDMAGLDPFLIKAPIGGVVELAIKRGALVKKDQPVAKILAQSAPRATFALPPGMTHEGADARVVSKADPSLAATCKVETSEPGKLVVSCPMDTGLASGTAVVLKPR